MGAPRLGALSACSTGGRRPARFASSRFGSAMLVVDGDHVRSLSDQPRSPTVWLHQEPQLILIKQSGQSSALGEMLVFLPRRTDGHETL